MNKGKQIINTIHSWKYTKYVYTFIIVLLTGGLTALRFSKMPKWPNEIITQSIFVAVCLLITALVFYIEKKSNKEWTIFFLLSIVVLLFLPSIAELARTIPGSQSLYFFISLLGSLLLGTLSGIVFNFSVGIVVYFLSDLNIEYFYYLLIFGTLCCLAVKAYTKVKTIIISGGLLVIGNVFFVLLFHYMVYNSIIIEEFIQNVIVFVVVVVLSFLIAIIVKNILSLQYSKKKLREKCRDTFPPLTEFKHERNESFFHSMQVAELGTYVGKTVDLDVDLIYAGGMYHDIGKGVEENYVKSSLKIARRYRLPYDVQKIIAEHNPKINKPTSMESLIIMLADSVISTLDRKREESNLSQEEVEKIVRSIFTFRLDQGMFSKVEINMKTYEKIRSAFFEYFTLEE